jgi:hypothetical protein
MFIETRIASASMSLEVRTPTKDRPVPMQESFSFQLLPTDEHDHLDLDTGEVFQDYSYARLHKNEQKLISAGITIRAAPDDSYYQYNVMRYIGETTGGDHDYPSSIHFDVFIAPTAFSELADNIRSRLLPGAITIGLFEDPSLFFTSSANPEKRAPIEFGWEPDGSGMIWHNKEKGNRTIAIESVRFDYEVVKPRYDEKQIDRLLPSQLDAPTGRTNEQIALVQASLAEMLKYLQWTTAGIVALAIMIGILIVKQGKIF